MPNSKVSAVVPAPRRIQVKHGAFVLPPTLVVIATTPDMEAVAALAKTHLGPLGIDVEVPTTPAAQGGLVFSLNEHSEPEAYSLDIGVDGIHIRSSDSRGAFYGLQSLCQVMAQCLRGSAALRSLPALSMEDRPSYAYRGMHLDVSRHFFDVDFVERYIDLLALHKFNVFHWHLTNDAGWRLESTRFPKLTKIGSVRQSTVIGFARNRDATLDGKPYGGFYTQEQVRHIVEYAAARQITVIPEIALPGHASALLAAYPELGCFNKPSKVSGHWGIFDDVLCPNDATFEFLQELFLEVTQLFPGPYVHIGGDEVQTEHWQRCPACRELMRVRGFNEPAQLRGYFVGRLSSLISALGKIPIVWGDCGVEGLPASTTMMCWCWQGDDEVRQAAQAGHPVILSPVRYCYFDMYQSHSLDEPLAIPSLTRLQDVYAFDPRNYGDLPPDQKVSIIGGQANLWTEYVETPDDAERMVLPRMSALAEALWSDPAKKSWKDFRARLPVFEHFLKASGYKPSNSHHKPHITAVYRGAGEFEVTFESVSDDMVYTLDGTAPTRCSAAYHGPFRVKGDCTIRAASLCGNALCGDARLTLANHLALGEHVTLVHPASGLAAAPPERLVNGQLSHDRIFDYPYWAAFAGVDMDAVITFDGPKSVSSVRLGFDAPLHRRLHRPCGVSVSGRNAEGLWSSLASAGKEIIDAAGGELQLNFSTVSISALRVIAHNQESVWFHDRGKMLPKTIYIDEIVVR